MTLRQRLDLLIPWLCAGFLAGTIASCGLSPVRGPTDWTIVVLSGVFAMLGIKLLYHMLMRSAERSRQSFDKVQAHIRGLSEEAAAEHCFKLLDAGAFDRLFCRESIDQLIEHFDNRPRAFFAQLAQRPTSDTANIEAIEHWPEDTKTANAILAPLDTDMGETALWIHRDTGEIRDVEDGELGDAHKTIWHALLEIGWIENRWSNDPVD